VRPLTEERGAWWPQFAGEDGHPIETPDGPAWLQPIPGASGTWLQLGPDDTPDATRGDRARAAAAVIGEALASERENASQALELMTRYEEIELLYGISEVLGRTVSLEEAARTIVREVSDVVGARRASIMVHDRPTDTLRVVAARGLDASEFIPVRLDDECSIAARVFRERKMLGHDAGAGEHPGCGRDRPYRGASFLSVPILFAARSGESRPVGVINLTDRIGEDAFSAGHKKLITAIANQIGAAIENTWLVEAERRRARLSAEFELAHHLQLALMPPETLLAKAGDVGVRTQPADSVGGDFYNVIALRRDVVGVMVGDVSSHGLSAALVMAHVIAAAGILAQSSASPEEALERLLEVIGDELGRAEMFVSLFYGVVDKRRGVLRYANAGHPQAFVVPGDGGPAERLVATAPPLGLAQEKSVLGAERPWHGKSDLLCLFTDGLTDARDVSGQPYGEDRLLSVVRRHAAEPARSIVRAVFEDLAAFTGAPASDDRTLLVLRR
jgi:sigma-B regulation protein RsbU (phosphoserine phosphatase)